MELIFLAIIFIIVLIILFLLFRIYYKVTVWSSFVVALLFALIFSVLVQQVIPVSHYDNREGVGGSMVIVWISVIIFAFYIIQKGITDTDEYAHLIKDRNIIFS